MKREPVKESFQCRKCGGWFFDYVRPGAERRKDGFALDLCNGCARKRPSYRHVPHPDQREFDFGD